MTKLAGLNALLRQDPQRAKVEIMKHLGGGSGDCAPAVEPRRAARRDQRPR